jgi:hypothetical protein
MTLSMRTPRHPDAARADTGPSSSPLPHNERAVVADPGDVGAQEPDEPAAFLGHKRRLFRKPGCSLHPGIENSAAQKAGNDGANHA